MNRSSKGFSLIEAIVALVIFSMSAMGIYAWISTNLNTLNRLSDVALSEQVVNESVERLKLVDLFSEQQGSFVVDSYQVNWKAELVEPVKNGVTQTGAVGSYDLGFYRVTLDLEFGSRHSLFSFRQVAYKKVREMKIEGEQ